MSINYHEAGKGRLCLASSQDGLGTGCNNLCLSGVYVYAHFIFFFMANTNLLAIKLSSGPWLIQGEGINVMENFCWLLGMIS